MTARFQFICNLPNLSFTVFLTRILTGEKLLPKRFITILIAFLSILMLTGCRSKTSKPDLEVVPHDDNTITIIADKAGISGVGGAGITIEEEQQLVIDSSLSKGSIQLKLFLDNEPAGVDASLDEILHTGETPALDVAINSAGTTEHPLHPGEYMLFVNVLERTTGNITLSAK